MGGCSSVPIVSAAVGLSPCCSRLRLCRHPCFCWRPYCVGGPVVVFIPAVPCFSAVVSGHDDAVILNVACCWLYCCCLCHCYCLHPDIGKHPCCCWCSLSTWWFPVAGSLCYCWCSWCSQGVGVSAVPFEYAVAGSPAVTGFPAVEGVPAVASVPADPSPCFCWWLYYTYWIVEWDVVLLHFRTIGLWLADCHFFCYQPVGISSIVLDNSNIGYRTLSHLCLLYREK